MLHHLKGEFMNNPIYNHEEFQEIKNIIHQFIDSSIAIYAEGIDKYYKIPSWFEKIPFLRNYILSKEEQLQMDRTICAFLNFCQTHAAPLFLKSISSEENYNLLKNEWERL